MSWTVLSTWLLSWFSIKHSSCFFIKHSSCFSIKHSSCFSIKHSSCFSIKHSSCFFIKHSSCFFIEHLCLTFFIILYQILYIVIVILIHTFLWHRFRLDSWETLCYLYRVNKTLWERKSLVVYTTALRSRNNEIDTVLSSNESIASIQRVTLE